MNRCVSAAILLLAALSQFVFASPPESGLNSAEAFSRLLEQRWSLAAIKTFCIPERRHNDAYQNLVVEGPTWKGQLYSSAKTGFDKIYWYATIKDGKIDAYSLNVSRGDDSWLLEIGTPENMDKPPRIDPDPSAPHFVGHK